MILRIFIRSITDLMPNNIGNRPINYFTKRHKLWICLIVQNLINQNI